MKSIDLYTQTPDLIACKAEIEAALGLMIDTYRKGGKILLCGNGGSCADCDHIVGELMKGFLLKRPMDDGDAKKFKETMGDEADDLVEKLQRGIPAISLPAQSAVLSAFANDVDADLVYAQLVFGYGRPGDLLIGLSTSGNSKNVVHAVQTAKAMGIKTLSLTGAKESKLSQWSDCAIRVPETETYRVQELHLPVYHELCAAVEAELFH